jgi:hypothetical protein
MNLILILYPKRLSVVRIKPSMSGLPEEEMLMFLFTIVRTYSTLMALLKCQSRNPCSLSAVNSSNKKLKLKTRV